MGNDKQIQVSSRAQVRPSILHQVFDEANAVDASGGDPVIRMHVGDPPFAPSPQVAALLAERLAAGQTDWTGTQGSQELRMALRAKLADRNRIAVTPEDIFVCPGSTQGLATLLQVLTDPGDEVLIPEWHWPLYTQCCALMGVRPIYYPLDEHLSIDPDRLASAAGTRTKAVIVNTPSNPGGALIGEAEQAGILALADRHGWAVISDEAYEDFTYTGSHTSIASLESDRDPGECRVVSVFSFSKSYAIGDYRLGYLAAPNPRIAAGLRRVQEATILMPSSIVEIAGLAALGDRDMVRAARALVAESREHLAPLVSANLLPRLPAGGWYVLVELPQSVGPVEDFVRTLLHTRRVALTPARRLWGSPSGISAAELESRRGRAERTVRLSFCGAPDLVGEGVARLLSAIEDQALAPRREGIQVA